MEDYITRSEHKEYASRIDAENQRQNRRLDNIESSVSQMMGLTVSVEKMATSMENMVKEQERQGERLDRQDEKLDELSGRDGETWRKVISHIIMLVVGAVVTVVLSRIGF